MFLQCQRYQDLARITGSKGKGNVASALRMSTSVTAFGKIYSTPISMNREDVATLRTFAVNEDQGDAEEEGVEGDANVEYAAQTEEVLYA